MSPTTAPIFPEGPVTPYRLADLLREARAFLRDASRDGQLLGMRIDEALSQWDANWFPAPFICGDISEADLSLLSSRPPSYLVVVGDDNLHPTITPLSLVDHEGRPLKPLTFTEIPWAGESPVKQLPHGALPQFYCTRCAKNEIEARRDGCARGPCPMAPLP